MVGDIERLSDGKKYLSITEAAKISGVTRQAIYVAIKKNKLKATKRMSHWVIDMDDLVQYKKDKYSREKSLYNGELLFDKSKGFYSINQVQKFLECQLRRYIMLHA